MLSNKLLQLVFVLLLSLAPSWAFALKSDESQPIVITADQATADKKNMISIFTGNVVITKGSLIVHANKGVASEDKAGNRTLTLYGTPVTFLQTADDGQKINGQCNRFDYNSKSSLAVLTGRARVNKGKSSVIGDVLTYNTQTQVYSATAGFGSGVSHHKSGRITVILDQESAAVKPTNSAPHKQHQHVY